MVLSDKGFKSIETALRLPLHNVCVFSSSLDLIEKSEKQIEYVVPFFSQTKGKSD
jgi:hypothetical protein